MTSFEIEGIETPHREKVERLVAHGMVVEDNSWTVTTWPGRDGGYREVREGLTATDAVKSLLCLLGKYKRWTVFSEDIILVSPAEGEIVCFDTMTGTVDRGQLSKEQMVAVLRLCLEGDDIEGHQALYEIADEAIDGWANRPIP